MSEQIVGRVAIIEGREHAVVIGSGIAGLAAAQVLTEYYQKVTIIERDVMPVKAEFRPGIPQAHHAHTLLPFGQMIMEQLFTGLTTELIATGAVMVNEKTEATYFEAGTWQNYSLASKKQTISFSRPLLDTIIYRRLVENPRVEIRQGMDVVGLATDRLCRQVRGVYLRNRATRGQSPEMLAADLVVDASGRNSKAPEWLSDLGFKPPEEWRITSHVGYASRIYHQTKNGLRNWKKMYISPTPPEGTRGGVIIPLEDGRWHVTLIGISSDYPPTSEEGFIEFAQSLPAPEFYEAIREAEPLSRIVGYRRNENRVRRYEQLQRYLEGFIVLGDAAYTMNPIYALGMTAAAAASRVLGNTLKDQPPECGIEGLSETFQKRLFQEISKLWQYAVQNEWRWPETEISDNTEELEMVTTYSNTRRLG